MKPSVLITGANSGIGFQLARVFARNGHSIIVLGRDKGRVEAACAALEKEFGVTCHPLLADLTLPGVGLKIAEELKKRKLQVDILVNNAGIGLYGQFWDLKAEDDARLIATNIGAVIDLTHNLLPLMVERGSGYILNVGSMAGFSAGPYAVTYYASKAFMLSFSEGLRESLSGTGVGVTLVCPGVTSGTNFNWYAHDPEHASKRRLSIPELSAEEVAEIAYRGMEKHKTVIIPGVLNALLVSGALHLPRRLSVKLIGGGQKLSN